MDNKKSPKVAKNFYCEKCDYKCYKKSDFVKHLSTDKHSRIILDNENSPNWYSCECGKRYRHMSGLSKHRHKCFVTGNNNNINEIKDIMMKQQDKLLQEQDKRNEEQQKKIDQLANQISNMSLVTNNNTMNNKFNLNFFLNTQCKDAIDFQTFLQDHLQISQEDLFYFGNNGYVNGMMNIIDKSLGSIDVHKRPLHCTDIKRKIMYYKQGDGSWEKDEEKIHLKKLVKEIDNKTMDCLQNWEDGNRYKFEDMESQNFKWYFRVASETLGGDSSKDDQYMAKIMNHIVIETYVKKTNMLQNS